MREKKSVFWFLVWAVLFCVCSFYCDFREISYYLQNGTYPKFPPYADYQIVLDFVFLFILIPKLCISHYYARKEKNKAIKIATAVILIQNAICFIAHIWQFFKFVRRKPNIAHISTFPQMGIQESKGARNMNKQKGAREIVSKVVFIILLVILGFGIFVAGLLVYALLVIYSSGYAQ